MLAHFFAGIQNGRTEIRQLQLVKMLIFLPKTQKVYYWRQTGWIQGQVRQDRILAPACLHLYKDTDKPVSHIK